MSAQINNLLQSGEYAAPIPEPEHGSQDWAYGSRFGEIQNSSNAEGNSVVIDILPDGATEPVVIVSDITLTVRPLEGTGRAVIWNTEQADDAVRVVELDEDNPLALKQNDAYYYLNTGDGRLLLRDDSVPAFQEADEVMLNAKPQEGQIDGRAIKLPVDFLRGYEKAKKTPEIKEQTAIRSARPEDIDALHPIFETWIRDRDTDELLTEEIAELEQEIRTSVDSDSGKRKYFVVEGSEGQAIGVMGMQVPPHPAIMRFAATDNPMETINAYVAQDKRLGGAGKALAKYIESIAIQQGHTELLVNSGPRYKDTGWPFWTSLYGEPAGVAVGLYGRGGDAMVWRQPLTEPSLDIREARRDDEPFLRLMAHAAVFKMVGQNLSEAEMPTVDEAMTGGGLGKFVEGFGREGDYGLIAQKEGKEIGAAWYRRYDKAEGLPLYELSIALEANSTGQGIGPILITRLMGQAQKSGITEMSLQVHQDNVAGRKVYEGMGFQSIREADEHGYVLMVAKTEPFAET